MEGAIATDRVPWLKGGDSLPCRQTGIAVPRRLRATVASLQNDKLSEKRFFKLAKIGFSSKRKMLKNNLAAYMQLDQKDIAEALEKLSYNPNVRAQELNLADWAKLLGVFG
jgi:16S rRNA (adenine1518-N6/adenine1519-N6)-dimethyltransferase